MDEALYYFRWDKDGNMWPEQSYEDGVGVLWSEVQREMANYHYDMAEYHTRVGIDWETRTEEEYFGRQLRSQT